MVDMDPRHRRHEASFGSDNSRIETGPPVCVTRPISRRPCIRSEHFEFNVMVVPAKWLSSKGIACASPVTTSTRRSTRVDRAFHDPPKASLCSSSPMTLIEAGIGQSNCDICRAGGNIQKPPFRGHALISLRRQLRSSPKLINRFSKS